MNFAIVGMDCILPGVSGAEEWITKSRNQGCLVKRVPVGRWPFPPSSKMSASGVEPDRVTSDVGGFVEEFEFDPTRFGPTSLPIESLDELFQWVATVTHGALNGAVVNPARTALILGNLSLPTTEAIKATAGPFKHLFDDPGALDSSSLHNRWHSGLPAQLTAEALSLGGGAFALDAACSSGLYAVKLAMERLEAGLCDAAIAAGAQRADSSFLALGFSQLHAVSKSGTPSPLDASADGLVIGEGAAAVLIKRLDDAISANDTIHAVIRGGGLSNDGASGNMLAPQPAGQLRALQAAYRNAKIDPQTVGYFELHATGTSVGDAAELQSLTSLLEGREAAHKPVISSAKAIVGHTITAAGIVGLLRAVGAVRDGILPASTNCPNPIAASRGLFTILDEPQPFECSVNGTRRAGVSAFGFGGTNAHIVVEEFTGPLEESPIQPPCQLAISAIATDVGGCRGLQGLRRPNHTQTPAAIHRGIGPTLLGDWIPSVSIDITRFKVPPTQLEAMLPQQLLMLDVAADALAQTETDPKRTAVVIGMSVDMHVAEYVYRQLISSPSTRDLLIPPLDASRVQGLLPNFTANRISAALGLEGPSFSVSSEELSGIHALEQASMLLNDPDIEAVLVGAVDLHGHCGSLSVWGKTGGGPITESAVALVITRSDKTPSSYGQVESVTTHSSTAGEINRYGHGNGGAADGLLNMVTALSHRIDGEIHSQCHVVESQRATVTLTSGSSLPNQTFVAPDHVLIVAHSGPVLRSKHLFYGQWVTDSVPRPNSPAPDEEIFWVTLPDSSVDEKEVSLNWAGWVGAPDTTTRTDTSSPSTPVSEHHPEVVQELMWLNKMAQKLHASEVAMANAHITFIQAQSHALEALATTGGVAPVAPATTPFYAPAPSQPITPKTEKPLFDCQDLKRFAEGPISSVFGPKYADLDQYSPTVRLPMEPLLLVSRVLSLKGERGDYSASEIVTEYDIPEQSWWSDDGKAPPAIIVESGQADLMLVSYLGIDADSKGERLYRLLDCDLTFHRDRPALGTTLRHYIRINYFARMGGKVLFYFEYDCVDALTGEPILTMRNGCAGFFTPAELSTPQGLTLPTSTAEGTPITPLCGPPNSAISADDITALESGDLKHCFGAAFEPANNPHLSIAKSPWRMIHAIDDLRLDGGHYGLGGLRATQNLHDDDWFNTCHFKGDPCMPGTLMFDGCVQALQVWLLATGAGAHYKKGATFEPLADVTTKLRCRGQVIPGHKTLVYEVRVKEAHLGSQSTSPFARADVILYVDGLPAVHAEDVTLQVRGERDETELSKPETLLDYTKILEFSIGDPQLAFGPSYVTDPNLDRVPRIPGPPYLTMSRILSVKGQQLVVGADSEVIVQYDIDPDAWYFKAVDEGSPIPLAILMEIALQPCGWLTAWQGASIHLGGDLYFRNLGGNCTAHTTVWPDSGTLTTTATVTSTSQSAGMLLYFFEFEVVSDSGLVVKGNTHFGYFTAASLASQKGLSIEKQPTIPATPTEEFKALLTPRTDLRMIDRIISADDAGGQAALGRYTADYAVKDSAWFFTAHFHQDPVMPGSLGLEGLSQLAAWALKHRFNLADDHPIDHMAPQSGMEWVYRGQVPPGKERLTLEIEVTEISEQRHWLTYNGTLLCDGLPIYALTGHSVTEAAPSRERSPADIGAVQDKEADGRTSTEQSPFAPLIDTFDPSIGEGTLLLNPNRFEWLKDHCPDLVTPALPMAFAIEVCAEAANALFPDKIVVELTQVVAKRWLAVTDDELEVTISTEVIADSEGPLVRVSLGIYKPNLRFPRLSGPVEHMFATVKLGDHYCQSIAPPALIDAATVSSSAKRYYSSGYTFHGPSLHLLESIGSRGAKGAISTLRSTIPQHDESMILDAYLLDGATHPMLSGLPETWKPDLEPGMLAYPVRCHHLKIHGPNPTGPATCQLELLESNDRTLTFNVWLSSESGPWLSFEWIEAIVPGGPILGAKPPLRRPYALVQGSPELSIGEADGVRWKVSQNDLIAPLPESLPRMVLTPNELNEWRKSTEKDRWFRARVAAKEAIRGAISQSLGHTLHPQEFEMTALRDGLQIVTAASTLSADEFIQHLGPTRIEVATTEEGDVCWAKVLTRQ